MSADRAPAPNASAPQAATTNSETTNTATTNANTTTNAPNGAPTISVQPGLPFFLPGAAMRVQSFPLEIRTVRPANVAARPQNNNNNTVNTSESAPVTSGTTPTTTSNAPSAPGANNTQEGGGQGGSFNFHNPNVEFFMEVTPEGITIDSLETTLVGSNQANDCKCCDCPC